MSTDKNRIKELYLSGLGYIKIAKIFKVSRTCIQSIIKKMGIAQPNRAPKTKIENDELIKVYINGWGILKISKIYNISERNVSRRLKKLGILDSSRKCLKKEGSRRSRRTAMHDFKNSVKKDIFNRNNGICEICNNVIGNGDNWRIATYHHKTLVSNGGDGSIQNCMVLHSQCHKDNFYELHGFDFQKLDNYKKIARPPKKDIKKDVLYFFINKGMNIAEIARVTKYDRGTITLKLKELKSTGDISEEVYKERRIGINTGYNKITESQVLSRIELKPSEIAKELGVSERAVYYKLKKLRSLCKI
jgi:DNA-binding transcriptional regulator GbsR (MarR family)